DAGPDPGLVSQRPDLARPHEAFLADILARGVGGRPGPLQRRQEWCSLILSHVRSRAGRTASTVPAYYPASGMTERPRVWFSPAAGWRLVRCGRRSGGPEH